MKKSLGFMAIMFVLTAQNALGLYAKCIHPRENCDNICRPYGGVQVQLPPPGPAPGDKGSAEELGLLTQYLACQPGNQFLCVCRGD